MNCQAHLVRSTLYSHFSKASRIDQMRVTLTRNLMKLRCRDFTAAFTIRPISKYGLAQGKAVGAFTVNFAKTDGAN